MNYSSKPVYQALDPESFDDQDPILTPPTALKFSFHAMCTSDECAPKTLGIQKNVDRFQEVCLDCGHYLYWDRRVLS